MPSYETAEKLLAALATVRLCDMISLIQPKIAPKIPFFNFKIFRENEESIGVN